MYDYPKLEQPNYKRPITDEELAIITKQMELAEQRGLFDGIFTAKLPERQFPTKEGFVNEIKPDMKLYKSTFLKIYGYEISFSGFSEIALSKLETAGCTKAREYYERFVSEYEEQRKANMKSVAADYLKQLHQEYERKEREEEWQKKKTQNLTENELNSLFMHMLEQGIVETPEQFVTVLEGLDQ